MKKFLLLAILPCLFLAPQMQAQTAGNVGTVSGIIYDESETTGDADTPGIPVVGAKVTLVSLPDKEELEVIITAGDGVFTFEEVPFGDYEILVEYVSGLIVSTTPFVVDSANITPEFLIPVITEATAPLYGNLRVVNPANVRGDEVSTFAP